MPKLAAITKYAYFILLLLILFVIIFSLVFNFLFSKDMSPELEQKISQQQNPFVIHKDSAAIIWKRASLFFKERKRIITGGEIQKNDSMIFLPYYNDYHKGNSIKILKKAIGDSVEITAWWWYSGMLQESGGKEIALYMQTGIGRYDFKN
jgi:hypothetical protein